jgi:hydrogenase expression/formation protein HypC
MCLAIPGKVMSIAEGVGRIAKVQFGGITRTASLDLVPEAEVGDYVLVHVGFAISKIDEAEAKQVFEYLVQMGEAGELAELTPDAPKS